MNIGIVIPWRSSGDPDRDANCEYVVRYYQSHATVALVDDGREAGQQFNRHAAYNRGLRWARAAGCDVVLWNEADTILPWENVVLAARTALDQPGMVLPYTERHELGATQTQSVLAGEVDPFTPRGETVYSDGSSIGQASVTSLHTMDLIGGRWDEGFKGWGYDDNAMFHIFSTLAGKPRWVAGKGVHLWHTPAYRAPTPASRIATDHNAARSATIHALHGTDLLDYLAATA